MLDPELPTNDDSRHDDSNPVSSYWKAPFLDPGKALPPYSGYRAGRLPAYHPPVIELDQESAENETPRRRSRLGGCLWIAITAVVILSLLGTSFLTYFAVRREASQSQELLRSAEQDSNLTAEMMLQDSTAPLSETNAPPLPTTAAVVPAQGQPAAPALNRLVLVNPRGQLETVSPDGQDRRQLTQLSDGTIFQFPAWSPDGMSVAAIGTNRDGGGIYVFNDLGQLSSPESASRYFSPTELPIYLYWSPDSSNVAFIANQGRDNIGLSIVPGEGDAESRVLAEGSPMYWNWAGDSEVMLLHAGETGDQARLVAIDSSGEEQTPNLARPGYFQAPGISASGRYWTYAEEEGQGVSTLVVADTGTGERRLVEQAGSVAMTWSPTHERLAYTSGRVDSRPFWGALRLVDAETGDTQLLTRETVLAFFWSPDGSKIAYITVNTGRPRDSYARESSGLQYVSRMAQPVQQGNDGFLSLSIVDTTTRQGLRLMNFQPTAAFATQFMPFFAQYALSHFLWSPDSSSLVLPVRDGSNNVVMVVPADGGVPRVVAEGDMAFWSQR